MSTAPSLKRLEDILAVHTVYEAIHQIPFEVRIPQRFTYDEDELAIYGRNLSGNPEEDDRADNSEIRVALSIAAIAEHFENAVPISLYRREIIVVYELIVRHLALWRNYVENKTHTDLTTDIPVEELQRLSDLAQDIHEDAVQARNHEMPEYVLHVHPGTMSSWRGGLGSRRTEVTGVKEPTSIIPKIGENVETPVPKSTSEGGIPKFTSVDSLLSSMAGKKRLL